MEMKSWMPLVTSLVRIYPGSSHSQEPCLICQRPSCSNNNKHWYFNFNAAQSHNRYHRPSLSDPVSGSWRYCIPSCWCVHSIFTDNIACWSMPSMLIFHVKIPFWLFRFASLTNSQHSNIDLDKLEYHKCPWNEKQFVRKGEAIYYLHVFILVIWHWRWSIDVVYLGWVFSVNIYHSNSPIVVSFLFMQL